MPSGKPPASGWARVPPRGRPCFRVMVGGARAATWGRPYAVSIPSDGPHAQREATGVGLVGAPPRGAPYFPRDGWRRQGGHIGPPLRHVDSERWTPCPAGNHRRRTCRGAPAWAPYFRVMVGGGRAATWGRPYAMSILSDRPHVQRAARWTPTSARSPAAAERRVLIFLSTMSKSSRAGKRHRLWNNTRTFNDASSRPGAATRKFLDPVAVLVIMLQATAHGPRTKAI